MDVIFTPQNAPQRLVARMWPTTKVAFLLGSPGTGKTHVALALALRSRASEIWLARPTVDCDEDLGFLPGDIEEKLGPWLAPFEDVLGRMSFTAMDKVIGDRVQIVAVGKLRGRTVSGVLIVDEAQNLTRNQLRCILTRLGEGGKVILCGDPNQSDIGRRPPLVWAANRLSGLEGVETVWFAPEDCCRDPLIVEIEQRLR